MSHCTWVMCDASAEYPRVSSDGEEWCRLCKSHDFTLEQVLTSGNPANILGAWVKAQGGADAAAKRTEGKNELTKIVEHGILGRQEWDQAAGVLLSDDLGAPRNVGVHGAAVAGEKVTTPGTELDAALGTEEKSFADQRRDTRMAEVPALYRETHERLAVELALNMDDAQAVFARHGHDIEAAAALIENPVFITLLERVTDEVRENGTSFKMKARLQAEELLATSYDMATDPLISPAVRAQLIQWTSKVAGLEPKDKEESKGGGGLTLSITFTGQQPQQVIEGRVPVVIDQS